jgi:hypothetical protein
VEGSKALQAFRTGSVSCVPHERAQAIMAISDRGGAATAVSIMRGRSHRTRISAGYAAHSQSQLPWLNETPKGGGVSCCPSEPKETPLERFIRRLQLRLTVQEGHISKIKPRYSRKDLFRLTFHRLSSQCRPNGKNKEKMVKSIAKILLHRGCYLTTSVKEEMVECPIF